MSSNKTISINPNLFNLKQSKTKKNNKESKEKPLISHNIVKKHILKRIKQHKQQETTSLENNKKKKDTSLASEIKKDIKENTSTTSSSYNDEFMDSLNYLQNLSTQRKIKNDNEKKQKQKENLDNKTIKNYQSSSQRPSSQSTSSIYPSSFIHIDLPEELMFDKVTTISNENPIKLNTTNIKDTIPYGILKNGNKPTYRVWNKTQRNNIVTNSNSA